MKLIFSEYLFISLFRVFCSSLRLKIYNNSRIKMQKYFAYLLQILQRPVSLIHGRQGFFPALPARECLTDWSSILAMQPLLFYSAVRFGKEGYLTDFVLLCLSVNSICCPLIVVDIRILLKKAFLWTPSSLLTREYFFGQEIFQKESSFAWSAYCKWDFTKKNKKNFKTLMRIIKRLWLCRFLFYYVCIVL